MKEILQALIGSEAEELFDPVLAVLNVPAGHRKRLRMTNHVERVNRESIQGDPPSGFGSIPRAEAPLWGPIDGAAGGPGRHDMATAGGCMSQAPQGVCFGRALPSLH